MDSATIRNQETQLGVNNPLNSGASGIGPTTSNLPGPPGNQLPISPQPSIDQHPEDGGRDSPKLPITTSPNLQRPPVSAETSKTKRVRTGCLTCRERHLKCDETLPRCQNCLKSDRVCKRGIRLNFIDTQTISPPYKINHPPGTQLAFQDESRDIASEYIGGSERYPPLERKYSARKDASQFVLPGTLVASLLPREVLPVSPPLHPGFIENSQLGIQGPGFAENSCSAPNPAFIELPSQPSYDIRKSATQSPSFRPYLNNTEEVFLMQVFVEEIGLWMDSMDADKHFTHIVPFHALGEPMLLNSFLACGARHLHLVNPSYSEDRAIHYYDAASRDFLACLQNPNRDTVLCATTAVILNVYELMCESAMRRMNHIAGARALIKECRWNGRTPGLGGACFWINIGIELLSCLHFNWQLAWDPDNWGMDIDTEPTPPRVIAGHEEMWTHRMVYICAKIANFRASTPIFHGTDTNTHRNRVSQRCQEWNTYKRWCDEWEKHVPLSMTPLGYLQPWQTHSKSSFPEVWLVKRPAIVGRLFYHTACTLLAKVHPIASEFTPDMRNMQQSHAHDICGIVAHVKDRGVASVSIRCLAIAAECLDSRDAQEEVLEIFDKIIKETGWRVEFIKNELKETWGWNTASQHQQHETLMPDAGKSGTDFSLLNSPLPPAPKRQKIPSGIVNPTMATADFSMKNHPYQNHYVPPHPQLNSYQYDSY